MSDQTENEVVIPAGPDGKPLEAAPAKPVSAADSEKKPEVNGDPEPFEYAEVPDDPGLNIALKFVGKQGIGTDHPALQAALKGDFSFLEAELASRGAKAAGYEQILKLAQKSWDNHVATQAESIAATAEQIHKAVGGEESWAEIQTWAKANADPEEKVAMNAMLNAGGFQARAAATLLAQLHAQASGTVKEPADAAPRIPANNASPAANALSPAQFQIEMSALVKKVGSNRLDKNPDYAKLLARRAAYRGA